MEQPKLNSDSDVLPSVLKHERNLRSVPAPPAERADRSAISRNPWAPDGSASLEFWRRRDAWRSSSVAKRPFYTVMLARSVASYFRASSAIPQIDVSIDRSVAGDLLHPQLSRKELGVPLPRVPRSVLALPESVDEYTRGKKRKGVRQELNRARARAIQVEEPSDVDARIAAYAKCEADKVDDLAATVEEARPLLVNPSSIACVGKSSDGETLCFGAITVCGDEAFLARLVSIRDLAGSTAARYAVHTELVRRAIELNVSRIWTDGVVMTHPGLQYFQRMLGYETAIPRVKRV